MLNSLKRTIKYHLKNIPGWRTRRKIVVFESDDWGSNRIASGDMYNNLLQDGFRVDQNPYDKYDTIEREEDLEALYDVLTAVRDQNGRHAVFTPYVNPANPDFAKIEASGFEEYYYESFFETLERTGEKEGIDRLYREGIESGIFQPQYHGREHLAVPLWLKYLRNKNSDVLRAFKHHFYSVPVDDLNHMNAAFRPTFYYETDDDLRFLASALHDGADLFESLFGYRATVFIPPNGIFPESLQEETLKAGITTMVVSRIRDEPTGNGEKKSRYHRFGEKNPFGQIYYIRTCAFEPYDNRTLDYCLPMVSAAFRCGKPAIISTHRVNYNGSMDPSNRQKGLKALQDLLQEMLKRWPDIEFMSSSELSALIHRTK